MNNKRLFFAIFPPPVILQNINDIITQLKLPENCHALKSEKAHITILFIGEVPENTWPELIDIHTTTSFPKFHLNINKIRYLHDREMLWFYTDSIPEQLTNLVYFTINESKNLEHDFVKKYPFIPHITIAKRLEDYKIPDIKINLHWEVIDYALVESTTGEDGHHKYKILQKFTLK